MHFHPALLVALGALATGCCAPVRNGDLEADLAMVASLRQRLQRRDAPADLKERGVGYSQADGFVDTGCVAVWDVAADSCWLKNGVRYNGESRILPFASDDGERGASRDDVVHACLEAERTGFALLLRRELAVLATDERASRQARVQAVQALAVARDAQAERTLLQMLDDDVAGHQAMIELGARRMTPAGRKQARAAASSSKRALWLLQHWHEDWEAADVRVLVDALAGPLADEALAVLLRGGPSSEWRIEAALERGIAAGRPLSVHALAYVAQRHLGSPSLRKAVEAATTSEDRRVREIALQALGAIGGAEAMATLLGIVDGGSPEGDVSAAILGLARIGVAGEPWARVLEKVTRGNVAGWKRAAIDRMLHAGVSDSRFETLVTELANDPDHETKMTARMVLASIRRAAGDAGRSP